MQHQNSVFHGLLKHVPWHLFASLVEDHGAYARVRRLSTKGQFVALLYGQFSGASSLREIVTGLSSHAVRLYHVGAEPVRRSTFSDANAQRPSAVFTDLLAAMMKQAHRGLRRKLAETTHLIDATSFPFTEAIAGWARFSAGVCGAKMHVIYDADADRPIHATVSAANINYITEAQQMPIEPGASYVFDLGYYDYACGRARCRRLPDRHPLQSNTRLDVVEELASPKAATSSPTASASSPCAKPAAAATQCGTRSEKCASRPTPARYCASCRTISTPALKKSPIFIANAGHRTVLPLGQADPQDRPLRRYLRECHSYPDCSRAHRLFAAAPGSSRPKTHSKSDRLRQIDPRQPHAPQANRSFAHNPAQDCTRSAPDEPPTMLNLNRTAVGQARA